MSENKKNISFLGKGIKRKIFIVVGILVFIGLFIFLNSREREPQIKEADLDSVESKEQTDKKAEQDVKVQEKETKFSDEQIKAAESKIARAEELLGQLKKWEEKQNWEPFFSNKDGYRKEIKGLLTDVNAGDFLNVKAAYLLVQLKEFFDVPDQTKAFENFLDEVKKINRAEKKTLVFLKDVILDLSEKTVLTQKRKLSSLYLSLLKASSSKGVLKKEAESFYNGGDIDNFAAVAESYISLIDDKKEFEKEAFNIVKKAGCYGFKESCAPYFTEDVFQKLVDKHGYKLEDHWMYLRGYNLEQALEYEKAVDVYKSFISKFSQSSFYPEVIFRLGYIYMYKEGQFSLAQDKFSDIEQRVEEATKHLDILTNRDFQNMSYNEKTFFKSLFKEREVPIKGKLQLKSISAREFTGKKVKYESISFSSDTGCLSPRGLFLWSGDLGKVEISTNTPVVKTAFNQKGFKVVNLVEKLPEGVLGYDAILTNIYEVQLRPKKKGNYKKGEVNFNFELEPYFPKKMVKVFWKVADNNNKTVLESKKNNFSYSFSEEGKFWVDFSLFFLGKEIYHDKYPVNIILPGVSSF